MLSRLETRTPLASRRRIYGAARKMGTASLVLIALSHNISFVGTLLWLCWLCLHGVSPPSSSSLLAAGKTWWVSMLVSRVLLVLLTGFTLYSDDRFVCNTIQPGCSNACFDTFAPVSVYHLWLFHCILLGLPHVVFATYVAHEMLSQSGSATSVTLQTSELSLHKVQLENLLRGHGAPRFHCSYLLTVLLRITLEAFFGTGQFFIFGLSVPKSFLCYEAPCVSGVECYVSKSTEKTLMLNVMLGVSSLSVLLSLLDLVSCLKAMGRWRRKETMLVVEMSKEERSSVFSTPGSDEGRRSRPSGSSSDANKDRNHSAAGPADPKVIQTDACSPAGTTTPVVPDLRGAPSNPRGPTPEAATKVGLYHLVAANSGQQSECQDKRAWV